MSFHLSALTLEKYIYFEYNHDNLEWTIMSWRVKKMANVSNSEIPTLLYWTWLASIFIGESFRLNWYWGFLCAHPRKWEPKAKLQFTSRQVMAYKYINSTKRVHRSQLILISLLLHLSPKRTFEGLGLVSGSCPCVC